MLLPTDIFLRQCARRWNWPSILKGAITIMMTVKLMFCNQGSFDTVQWRISRRMARRTFDGDAIGYRSKGCLERTTSSRRGHAKIGQSTGVNASKRANVLSNLSDN